MTSDAWLVLASSAVAFVLGLAVTRTRSAGVPTRIAVITVGIVCMAILVALVIQGSTAMSIVAFSAIFVVTLLVAVPRGRKGNQQPT